MAVLLSNIKKSIHPAPDLIASALKFASRNPLDNAFVISNLTQLKIDCSIVINKQTDNSYIVGSYYMDLPFYNITLLANTSEEVKLLISALIDRHPEFKDQPIYGLYDSATAGLIENNYEVTLKNNEIMMVYEGDEIPDQKYDKSKYHLQQLTTDDLVQISHLYSIVPAMAWTPKVLELGPYFGVFKEEHLVSIAGVQSMTDLAAEVGNIVTHFKHRRNNLAYATTKAVTDKLKGISENIFLCVFADNEPAIKLYKKMGYVKYKDLYLLQYFI